AVVASAGNAQMPTGLVQDAALRDLVNVHEGVVSADAEEGTRGMHLVAAGFRAAELEAGLPSRHDPRRIDIPIKRSGVLVIAAEVKQEDTSEAVADTLARDAASHGVRRALLAILRP